MKKIILPLIALLLVIVIAIVNGLTAYKDEQYYPSTQLIPVNLNEAAVLQRLSKAIQIPTISVDDRSLFNPTPFEDFITLLVHEYPAINERAERLLVNNYNIVYKFEGSDPSLKPVLFMGHIDVVSVDEITLNKWTHPPFAGVIKDEIIWGRGAIDDKSTVMSLMEAMELTLNAHPQNPLKRTVYFAFGHDEEVGGKEGAQLIAKHFKEQGIVFEFVLDEGGVILKKGMMPNIDEEIAIIGVAEKGFMNIRMTVEQTGGHSSTPPEHTGPGILAQAIVKLENAPFPADLSFTNLTFDRVAHFADFGAKVAMANQWLTSPLIEKVMLDNPKTAASIRTTTAVTMLSGSSKSNVLPTKSTAVVNFRVMPGHSSEQVKAYVEQVIDNPQIKLEIFMASEPSKVSKIDHYGYRLIEQTIRETEPEVLVAPYMVQGGTDSKFFSDLSDAVYRFMRVKVSDKILAGMHGIDEHMPTEDYLKGVQFFHELIRKSAITPKNAVVKSTYGTAAP